MVSIEEHLAAALPAATGGDAAPDDRRVVEVLSRLGDPADVVAAAAAEGAGGATTVLLPPPAAPRASATRPVAAVVLLASAGLLGIVFPVAAVAWIAGIVLFVTSSSVWTRRAARIGGAILFPYVLITPAFIALEFAGLAWSSSVCESVSGKEPVCTSTGPAWAPWVTGAAAILFIAYVIAGLVVAIVLAVRALRATRVPA